MVSTYEEYGEYAEQVHSYQHVTNHYVYTHNNKAIGKTYFFT